MMKIGLIGMTLVSLSLSTTAFAVTFERDVPVEVQQQMTEDLIFVTTIQGSSQSELHKKIFGSVSGAAYDEFFKTRIRSVGLGVHEIPNAFAYVDDDLPNMMVVTENYIKISLPQIVRVMVLFHEARHTELENEGWPHAYCPDPFLAADGTPVIAMITGLPLAGVPACDNTPFGSYGSSALMLKNISKYCINCTEKVKMDAGIYADDQFKRIIDKDAIAQIKKDVYGLDEENCSILK